MDLPIDIVNLTLSSSSPASFLSLPPELIHKIIQFTLPTDAHYETARESHELFLSISLVCSTFRAYVMDFILAPCFISTESITLFTRMLNMNRQKESKVEKVSFDCQNLALHTESFGLLQICLESFFSKCQSIKEIRIFNSTALDLKEFSLLPLLQMYHISNCELHINASIIQSFQLNSLIELNLSGSSIPSLDLYHLLNPSCLPSLLHLSLHSVHLLSPLENEGYWITSNHLKLISTQLITQSISIQSINGQFNSKKTLFDLSAHPFLIRRIGFKFICQRTSQNLLNIWYFRIITTRYDSKNESVHSINREYINKMFLSSLNDLPNLKCVFLPIDWKSWKVSVKGGREGEEENELKPFLIECQVREVRVVFEEVPDDENYTFRSREFERMKLRELELE